jgi:spermidine synthase
MELWYTEKHTENVHFSIKVDKQFVSVQSEFQRIDVFQSTDFGRVITLDGSLMLTEKDEFIYHEMIVHVPIPVNPQINKVLVIGAGDGGVVRELTRYDSISHIDMVEIDEMVVEICKEYLPRPPANCPIPGFTYFLQTG